MASQPPGVGHGGGDRDDIDPVIQVRSALELELLRESDPDRWPESLARIAGVVAVMDVGPLDLLADTTVQVAGMAHQLAQERAEEAGTGDPLDN